LHRAAATDAVMVIAAARLVVIIDRRKRITVILISGWFRGDAGIDGSRQCPVIHRDKVARSKPADDCKEIAEFPCGMAPVRCLGFERVPAIFEAALLDSRPANT
jgi:hypothetical protein